MRFSMPKNRSFPLIITVVFLLISCKQQSSMAAQDANLNIGDNTSELQVLKENIEKHIIVGANLTELYLPLIKEKRIGIVANQTSVIFKNEKEHHHNVNLSDEEKIGIEKSHTNHVLEVSFTHLVDSLVALNIDIKAVFAPEHGFRGTADAGETIKDGVDAKTNLPIISLYGKNKKMTPKQLAGIDVMIFDIQDVGARFYTYISTLHYVMEACAEAKIPLLILDRPNPNGHYVDGPILEPAHKSFVGMHPVPIVHGMTIAEYAQMINGENWLGNGKKCELFIVKMKNYEHDTRYSLPIKPSPNLPNDVSINLYPSLCFFEGTNVSAGRGTSKQFQIFGSPYLDKTVYDFKFIPAPNEGAKYPKHDGKLCYGKNLSDTEFYQNLNLKHVISAYKNSIDKNSFFNDFFTNLAGNKILRTQIENGLSENEIKATWQNGLETYRIMRKNYLLYK